MRGPEIRSIGLVLASLLLVAPASIVFAETAAVAGDIPRTADGKPDLSGFYDIATLTPMQRPQKFGDNLYLSKEEAAEIERTEAALIASRNEASDPDREAPPEGGDGSPGASGNVGGYNTFWIDRGSDAFAIDGKFRTSILYDPANGRIPPMHEEVRKAAAERRKFYRANTGEAWWLDLERGPYDDMEVRPMAERCLLGFGSTAGPPMMPVLYNNLKRIVQTPTHVMILNEMVHDVRVVRLDSEHPPAEVKKWLGDSIGWWEGDTLVVETTNFRSQTALRGGGEGLKVVERFSRADADTLMYDFTVESPDVWESSWSGQYPWPAADTKVYEYACHEANYSFGNIMRGARLLEAEALTKSSGN